MPAWFPLVECNLAKKWIPTGCFAWERKTLCLSQLMCQEKGGGEGREGVHASKTHLNPQGKEGYLAAKKVAG